MNSEAMNHMRSLKEQIKTLVDEKCPVSIRPFACSFDLRMGKDKSFVVDANFFPTGWHRLPFPSRDSWKVNQQKVEHFFGWRTEEPIAVIPEHQLQNEDYLKNLAWLKDFYTCAGFKTFVVPITASGSIKEKMTLKHILGPCKGHPLEYYPYEIHDRKMWVEGIPMTFSLSQFDGSKSTLILKDPTSGKDVDLIFYPPHLCNWQYRRKHRYFEAYHRFVSDVEAALSIKLDHYKFSFSAYTVEGTQASVMDHWSEVEDWVDDVTQKEPNGKYWILKSDHGTYGLGVEAVHPGESVRDWSLRKIKSFRHGRHNMPVLGLVLQEGLPTDLFIDNKAAERVDYYFLGEHFGTFFRMHQKKSMFESLNRQGAEFANAPVEEEGQKVAVDIASLLAFGGICYEYSDILKRE